MSPGSNTQQPKLFASGEFGYTRQLRSPSECCSRAFIVVTALDRQPVNEGSPQCAYSTVAQVLSLNSLDVSAVYRPLPEGNEVVHEDDDQKSAQARLEAILVMFGEEPCNSWIPKDRFRP